MQSLTIFDKIQRGEIHNEGNRTETYVKANNSLYGPNQSIDIVIPNRTKNILTDLRSARLQFDVQLSDAPETPITTYIWQADPFVPVDSGDFALSYRGNLGIPVPFDSAPEFIYRRALPPNFARDWRDVATSYSYTNNGYVEIDNQLGTTGQLIIRTFPRGFSAFESGVHIILQENNLKTGGSPVFLQTEIIATPSIGNNRKYPLLQTNASNLFNRAIVEVNSRPVIDISDYNVLTNMILESYRVDYRTTTGESQRNMGHENKTRWEGLRRFHIPLDGLGFLDTILPLGHSEDEITIRLFTEIPTRCLILPSVFPEGFSESDYTYQIVDPQLRYHLIDIDKDESRKISRHIIRNGLSFRYETYSGFVTTLSGSGDQDVNLGFGYQSCTGIIAGMRRNSLITQLNVPHRLAWFSKNRLSAFRLRVGNMTYPRDEVDLLQTGDAVDAEYDITEALHQFQEFFGVPINQDCDACAGFDLDYDEIYPDFDDLSILHGRFLMAIPTVVPDENAHVSGINTTDELMQLELKGLQLTVEGTNTSDVQLNVYARYQGEITFKGVDGDIEVTY